MAKYRQLYTEFWSDSFVLELTPEEKYFYLYLISNSKTTQCGIYELSKKIIETETGYNRDTVEKLIKRFCDYEKILYCEETKELMVINWIKYNAPNNTNAIKCVNKELSKVKHKEFLKILLKKCQVAGLEVARIFENLIIGECLEASSELQFNEIHIRDLQGAYMGLPSNRIRNNKEEVTNKKQEVRSKEEEVKVVKAEIRREPTASAHYEGLETIVKIFEENVHAISPLEYEKLLDFLKHVSYEVIILAIDEAVTYNAKTMKYITQILNSWISNGIKTAEEVKTYQKQWAHKKGSNLANTVKKGSFCDYEQRTYDFDALEKQLLGLTDTEDL